MRYLSYDEYIDIGGTLEKTAFDKTIDRACGMLDLYTHNRVRHMADISTIVKACVRDLCEYLSANGLLNKAISSKSQTAGGVSESESYVLKTSESVNNDVRDIIYDYLSMETDSDGAPLLYRGCRS